MKLKAITVRDGSKALRYETLVERWEDILWIARRGTDEQGKEIINMEIECDSNGLVYTNTIEQVLGFYKDVKLIEKGGFAFEVVN